MSSDVESLNRRIVTGMAAGCLATVPMSATMLLIQRCLPDGEQDDLPPQKLMEELTPMESAEDPLPEMQAATWLAHFAFGTVAGGLYGAIRDGSSRMPILSGVAYGLGVWTSHYGLLFRGMRLRCSADRESTGRNLMMIAAHVVWGAALGGLHHRSTVPTEFPGPLRNNRKSWTVRAARGR